MVYCADRNYGDSGKCHYISFGAGTGVYRRDAFRAVLLWFAIGDDCDLYYVYPDFSAFECLHRLRIFRKPFDKKTRVLTSLLFLFSRGLSNRNQHLCAEYHLIERFKLEYLPDECFNRRNSVNLYLRWRCKSHCAYPKNYSFSLFWERWLLQDIYLLIICRME